MDTESVRVGIDIGTSKIVAVVTEYDYYTGSLLVLGVGESKGFTGLKRGKIVDLNSTITAISKACVDAMMMSGVQFSLAYINMPGEVDSLSSEGIVTVSSKSREVLSKDIERVLHQAKTVDISSDKLILHLFLQYFNLDEQEQIQDPVGMSGLRLQGFVQLVLTWKRNVSNTIKCFQRANITPLEASFNAYASSKTVLTHDDKDLGVIVLDIGAGSVDILVFQDGYITYSGAVTVAGDSITRDLSIGLKISETVAEKIKCEEGYALEELVDPLAQIEIPGSKHGEIKRISHQSISNIVQARIEEIFFLVKQKLEEGRVDFNKITSGVILTGGTSNLNGIIEISEKILNLQTRIGVFHNIGGLKEKVNSSEYSTVLGLCLKSSQDFTVGVQLSNLSNNKKKTSPVNKVVRFFKDMLG